MLELLDSEDGRRVRAEQVAEIRRQLGEYPDACAKVLGRLFGQRGAAGGELGGRAAGAQRCTKRLGSRLCGNWSEPGSDRCRLHPRRDRP